MISFGLNPWLLLPCALIAAGLTFLAYRNSARRMPLATRRLLQGLRFAALFVVLCLLFQPTWHRQFADSKPPVIGVLIDNSQSMAVAAQERPAQAAQEVRQLRAAFPDLPGTPRFFAFGPHTREVGTADSLHFAGAITDISQGLGDIREALREDHVRAVLLVTDGLYNSGRNPLYTATEYGIPIHTVAVGDTMQRRDLQIRRVLTNDIGYAGREQPVQVMVRTRGFADQDVEVRLIYADSVVATAVARLPGQTGSVSVDFAFEPRAAGLQQLTASVTRLDGEITHRNNTASVPIRVLESRQRILLLAAGPGPDLATIRGFLDGTEDAEVDTYIQKGTGAFYEGSFSPSPTGYDLIIMAGFPGRGASHAALDAVVDAAEAGTPLFFLAGLQTDLTTLRAEFDPYLPAAPVRSSPSQSEVVFAATAAGLQHPVMDFTEPDAFTQLPPLTRSSADWDISPDARVLAVARLQAIATEEPLLVVRSRAGHRTAALLGARTWRWKNLPDDLNAFTDHWHGLFEAITQWLTTPKDNRLVRIEPVDATIAGGVPALFVGQAYDESLNPHENAAISVEIVAPDGARYPYEMQPLGNGRFALDVGVLPEGAYSFEAEASRAEQVLGRDSGVFTVGALRLEYRETKTDVQLLRQLALRTGGEAFTPATVGRLADVLRSDSSFVPDIRLVTRERSLWHWAPVFCAVVLLLTIEWVVRKRAGLV